ncbi:MAG: 3'(2'),5'-bisphosphate nucleotidase CysQ [Motiliproteus sp.]|nr:3'(2'),5'-bisphosphate nucleotidase CysQ [Motiliproteus sp.]MCW9051344.1 3'(2'),5'-bisphosphate nucleotidase CysQ [Motiliproteus sp.]
MDKKALLTQIMTIAQEAGEAIMAIYQRPSDLQVETKDDQTPVTEADLMAHRHIVANLQRLTPEIPILSEESDPDAIQERRTWPKHWLVDPLDGTKEFIKRNGEFTVNIALIENGRSVLGVVYAPVSRTLYAGVPGFGAIKQDGQGKQASIKTKPLAPFKKISMVVSRSHPNPRLDSYQQQLQKLAPVTTTPMGSSLKLCLIADGLADIHIRLGRTCEWDIAAADAVLTAAGGRLTDLQGNPIRYNQKADLFNPDFLVVGDSQIDWLKYLPTLEN